MSLALSWEFRGSTTLELQNAAHLVFGLNAAGQPFPFPLSDDGLSLKTNERVLDPTSDSIAGAGDIIDVTLAMDTAILASGDVAGTTVAIANAVPANNKTAILDTVILFDEDDQGTAVDLYFFSANVSLGTVNGVPSISDANMRNFLGKIVVAAADIEDLGGVRVATKDKQQLQVKSGTDVRTIWVQPVCRSGTPTYTAGGLKLRLGFLW